MPSRGCCSYNLFKHKVSSFLLMKILLAIIFLSSVLLQKSDGQIEDWCISDEQYPDEELQKAMEWACHNGANCDSLQPNRPCFLPSTVRDHASYAFNSYYQNMKHKGASCYFLGAAVLTALNPSHGSCKFETLP